MKTPFASAPDTKLRFALLDGLRALAALAVVADHVVTPTLRALTPHRALAVDFFYVLSGFVLAHAYAGRLAGASTPSLSPWVFLKLRFARFWPMLAAAFALSAPVLIYLDARWGPGDPPYAWLARLGFGLLFLPTPQPLSPLPFLIVAPAHTMFFELFANLLLALAAPVLTRARLGALLAIAAVGLVTVGLRYDTVSSLGWEWPTFFAGFARVIYPFFAGVAAYLIWRARRTPALPAWAAALALTVILCAPLRAALSTPYEIVASLVLFPLLVLFSAGAVVRGLVETACLRAGALSYGFYLLHAPLNVLFTGAFHRIGVDAERLDLWMYALVVIAATALTALLQRFYDRPLQRWLNARLGADR